MLPWRDGQDEQALSVSLRELMAKNPKLRRVPNDVTLTDFMTNLMHGIEQAMPTEKELVNALGKPIVAKLIVDVDPWGRAMYRRTLLSAKVPKVPCMPLSAMFCARSAAPRTKAASRSPGRTWTTRAPVA